MQTIYTQIPYTLLWDRAPIDISFLFENEKPAGKHGFMTVKRDRFMFEDGTEMRFWGTNFNSGANFPEHDHSEKIARRLASMGINIVRFHQLDAEWATPNLFRFTKGPLCETTRTLDPQSLERLDYLIYCLKQEGIYVYLDMLCYRKFKSGDGVENSVSLPEAGKPYSCFSRKLIELQKEFNRQLWGHYNPYTGLCYKDEPAIAVTDITNENEMSTVIFSRGYKLEPYYSEMLELYKKWSGEDNIDNVDFLANEENIVRFKCETMKAYYDEIIRDCREMGVKIPVTGTNHHQAVHPALMEAHMDTDFIDGHAYTNLHSQLNVRHDSIVNSRNNMLSALSVSRVDGKPFFVSEWEEPWPAMYRAAAPILMAAAGSFQGWNGFTIHTYRYGTNEQESVTSKIGRDIFLGGSARGVYDTYNDPAKFGLFYHAALIMRRGDVKQAYNTVVVEYPDLLSRTNCTAVTLTPERHKVVVKLPGRNHGNDADYTFAPDDHTEWTESGEIMSDTGEIYRNIAQGYGYINSPMTKAVYGFHSPDNKYELGGVEISVKNDFATVAISSISDKPICGANNLLLTAVGRADNKDVVYHEGNSRQVDCGTGPVMVEVIRAKIRIKTSVDNLRVWSVDNEGFYRGAVSFSYENGYIAFETGVEYASIYYLIQAQ